jgi:hypothetical protein
VSGGARLPNRGTVHGWPGPFHLSGSFVAVSTLVLNAWLPMGKLKQHRERERRNMSHLMPEDSGNVFPQPLLWLHVLIDLMRRHGTQGCSLGV